MRPLEIALKELDGKITPALREAGTNIAAIEQQLDQLKAPWTPGRKP
jgi:hypothetical protein